MLRTVPPLGGTVGMGCWRSEADLGFQGFPSKKNGFGHVKTSSFHGFEGPTRQVHFDFSSLGRTYTSHAAAYSVH